MNIILLVLIFTFIGCSHDSQKELPPKIDLFCQDLSVALQKIDIYSMNIANKETTRSEDGGYYKTKIVVNCEQGICLTKKDESPPILKFQPKHPDADKNGYVAYNNLNVSEQMALMIQIQRTLELVLETAPVKKDFFAKQKRNSGEKPTSFFIFGKFIHTQSEALCFFYDKNN